MITVLGEEPDAGSLDYGRGSTSIPCAVYFVGGIWRCGLQPDTRLQLSADPSVTREARLTGVVEYLLANPLLLAPILILAAVLVFAVLKRLLKLAMILVIAGVLYMLLLEYVGRA
jgi:hypothetical protein